ncbi:MAG: diphthine--ammonia ligase [Bacteroidales bacterium]|nr:diphthine--ammonia ligase [Bacteroidales bacterium]
MKAFASWSGGKDCMLALYRFLQNDKNEVAYLVNMCDDDGKHSRSHRIKKHLIAEQASMLNIPIVQETTGTEGYETYFKFVINRLKKEGVTAGIFGDIYLIEHRKWIERVCADLDIQAIFPIWGDGTRLLLKEFIETGFKALTVAVDIKKLNSNWLGRELDLSFYNDIVSINDVDPCAENGEYHSFVYGGPIFSKPVSFSKGEVYQNDNHIFLQLNREV